MNKEFTILICTYNGEKYLEKVIESIKNQNNFAKYIKEVIVVDNCSIDLTKNICKKLIDKYDFLKYEYEKKPGLANARKHVINVKSRWTIFLDDDNIVCQDWLVNMVNFIKLTPHIGVANSNSIAKVDFELDNQNKVILNAILPYIACTHMSKDDVNNGIKSSIKGTPFGAGMFCLTEELKNMINEGWTKSVGRSGEGLGSGEDGEIAKYILDKGYDYGYNYNASIYHMIPKKRLEKEYIKNLRVGITIGTYNFLSQKDSFVIARLELLIRRSLNLILYPIRIIFEKNEVKKMILKMSFEDSINFIKLILKDCIIKR